MRNIWDFKSGPFLLALYLGLLPPLIGCSSLLSREYSRVTVHSAAPISEGDSNTLRVENYQELVNGLIYLVEKGVEEAAVRFSGESSNFKQLLDEACLEVVQEDPLGAYAVDFIKYSLTNIVGSLEAQLHITYRRTYEQISSVVDATGTSAIRSELRQALSTFSNEVVLRINYFDEEMSYLHQLVREAYLSNPESALDFPEAELFMYPSQGHQRIVEVLLSYHQPRQTLEQQRNALMREVAGLIQPLSPLSGNLMIQEVAALMTSIASYDPNGGSTPYDAILLHRANAQGMALGLALLIQSVQQFCVVVDGTFLDEPHIWNVVATEQGYRHIDLTQGEVGRLYTDQELWDLGYQWDSSLVPKCEETTIS